MPEILGAVYARLFHSFAHLHPKLAKEVLGPLLKHVEPDVRLYAVLTLAYHSSNRYMILALENDPNEYVRVEVREAKRVMKMMGTA